MDYTVYVKTNDNGYITEVNSSGFISDTSTWTEIDRGEGDRYHHAQGNYFERPIKTLRGAYQYKLVDGVSMECTPEEIKEQEDANQGPTEPSLEDRVTALEEQIPSMAHAAEQLAELDASYREGVNSV